jgi:hypothetical protein
MSDNWRRKKYYEPRVLLETADVLEPPFEGSLICLSGSDLYILRNLVQYAHRRSTFVSEYEENTYLAPTEEEWDDLDAIVGELEDKLMGCEDIVDKLTCICSAIQGLQASQSVDPALLPEEQPYYDNEDSTVEEDTGSPPVSSTWDDWRAYRCKGAQMIVDDVIDIVSN